MTALNVGQQRRHRMPILYKHPAEVWRDRLLNGVAGYRGTAATGKSPLIIVDFGTATTFDAISAKGEFWAA
jgi:type III pantothenate kinase